MPIHDHFDGEAHCVECGGACRLTGDSLTLSRIVRFVFEQWAWRKMRPSYTLTHAIEFAGVDVDYFKRRAKETHYKSKAA